MYVGVLKFNRPFSVESSVLPRLMLHTAPLLFSSTPSDPPFCKPRSGEDDS